MKKRHIPDSHTSHPNVTPLIDIVMCLIIFYMLVAKIGVSTGADAKIDIPASIRGTDIKDMGNTLTLNVRAGAVDEPEVTALIKVGSEPTQLHLRDPATGQNQLVNALKKFKKDNDKFQVIIHGDADMPYRFLEPVLNSCVEASVRNVNFHTKIVRQAEGS
jgi:biopolymer transport protein ExbD